MTTIVQLHLIPLSAVSTTTPHGLGSAPTYRKDYDDEYIAAVKGNGGAFYPYDEGRLKKPCLVSIFRSDPGRPASPMRELIPIRHSRQGIVFGQARKATVYQTREGLLQSTLWGQLQEQFSSAHRSMAAALGITPQTLEGYLKGALPKSRNIVYDIARRLNMNGEMLIDMWETDLLEAIDFMYQIPPDTLPLRRELISLVRLATVRLGELKPVQRILRETGFPNHSTYVQWNEVYRGILDSVVFEIRPWKRKGRRHGAFRKEGPRIIAESGVASEEDVILLLEELRMERRRFLDLNNEILAETDEDIFDDDGWWAQRPGLNTVDPFEYAAMIELSRVLKAGLRMLSPREEKVIRMRFGILERREYSQDEVAADFEVTHQRIQQIEDRAMYKLRNSPKLLNILRLFRNG